MAETKKKPAPKKKPAKRKKAVAKKGPEIISYAIKMVIPTIAYGNIQPEIIVKANSVEEAHDFIVPHMNKLWKEYYMVDGKRPVEESTPAPVSSPKPVTPTPTPVTPAPAPTKPEPAKVETPKPTVDEVEPFKGDEFAKKPEVETAPPPSSVAYVKATQAIEACLSLEAFELINQQVEKSVKLTEEDKVKLQPLLAERYEKLTEK